MRDSCDVAVIGAGAAGLFAALWAGRTAQAAGRPIRVVAFDGARTLGAKILVAGGGRCNVTHHTVSERDFAGSTQPAIRNVLRAFSVDRTVEFFASLGVELKREETGKLFPVTDSAHTVLDALLNAVRDAGAEIRHPARVASVTRVASATHDASVTHEAPTSGESSDLSDFTVNGDWGTVHARRVVLCMGGKALPKTGSDGAGYDIAMSLGHTITPLVVPALVPLVIMDGHWVRNLSGVAVIADLSLRSSTGKKLESTVGSTLCTHFGISGPAPLDISRHLLVARAHDTGAHVVANWLPGTTSDQFDRMLVDAKGRTPLSVLRDSLPERLARALCEQAHIDPTATVQRVPREARRKLVELATACLLPVSSDRGFTYAEATAGGVPLAELRLDSMESRIVPGLHIAGELCDVDGRIGGFNFQWAWASGYLAGVAAARPAPASQPST